MDLSKVKIDKDEYFNRFGENLDVILMSYDNPSNTGDLFLSNIQDSLNTYISANFNLDMNIVFTNMTENERTLYKEACLEQAFYVRSNSDLLNDSGYDNRAGVVANKSYINKIAISPKAKNKLISCGIWSRAVNNRNRGRWYGIWGY